MSGSDRQHEVAQPREAEDHAGVAFHPPVMLGVLVLLGFGLRALWPLPFLSPAVAVTVGPLVVVAAFAVFFWAAKTMRGGGASIPTGEPTETIVTTGPYSYSRNPIYVAMVTLLVGIALLANSLWFLGLAALDACLLWWGVIAREEAYLERKFGASYKEYMSSVRRWL